MENYIIAMDNGSTFIKMGLYITSNGTLVDMVKEKVQWIFPGDAKAEIDMQQFADTVHMLIKKIVKNNNLMPEQVKAIALTGQCEGTWPIGYDGKPVGNAITWADSRSQKEAEEIVSSMEALKDIYAITGGFIGAASGPSVLKWLRKNEPERFEKIKYVGTCGDWIKYTLTKEMTLGPCYSLDMLNTHTLEYSNEVIEMYGLEDAIPKLPEMRKVLENHSPLDEEVAQKLGLEAGIPVLAITYDQPTSVLGMGVTEPGIMCILIGTSENSSILKDTSDVWPLTPAIQRAAVTPNQWLKVSGLTAGTTNMDWAIKALGYKYEKEAEAEGANVHDVISRYAEKIPVGCEGVVYHPFISPTGERAPKGNASARAQFTGLDSRHTTDHMMRAVYEGVAYGIMEIADIGLGAPEIKQIRLGGGGSYSEFWCQMITDMMGIEGLVMEDPEVGARGVAMAAAVVLGLSDDFDSLVKKFTKVKKRYVPNMENHEKYLKMYKLYQAIYDDAPKFWELREKTLKEIM